MMNPNSFSILGYLSVLLWLAVPLLWLLRRRFSAPGWLALILAVTSLILATYNSRNHVNRIEVNRAEETVNQLDAAAAKRKAVEKARGGEVADIRFAEDGGEDFIDKAGMDDSDRKYLDSIDDSAEPASKRKKKTRGSSGQESGDLDDMLGGKEVISGVDSDALPREEEKLPPIFMTEAHMASAHRIDGLNLSASRLVVLLGILIFIADYLTRSNSYARAAFPLPLPSTWRNAFTPMPALVHRPNPARRSLEQELTWLTRRGDVFIYFAKEADDLPTKLPRLAKPISPIDLIHVDSDRISNQFIFESLWYGRSCFVVDATDRINELFNYIYMELNKRQSSRAHTKQTVHLVWGVDQALHDDDIADYQNLARSAGFSLFICTETPS
jgi:hypothetical protein